MTKLPTTSDTAQCAMVKSIFPTFGQVVFVLDQIAGDAWGLESFPTGVCSVHQTRPHQNTSCYTGTDSTVQFYHCKNGYIILFFKVLVFTQCCLTCTHTFSVI